MKAQIRALHRRVAVLAGIGLLPLAPLMIDIAPAQASTHRVVYTATFDRGLDGWTGGNLGRAWVAPGGISGSHALRLAKARNGVPYAAVAPAQLSSLSKGSTLTFTASVRPARRTARVLAVLEEIRGDKVISQVARGLTLHKEAWTRLRITHSMRANDSRIALVLVGSGRRPRGMIVDNVRAVGFRMLRSAASEGTIQTTTEPTTEPTTIPTPIPTPTPTPTPTASPTGSRESLSAGAPTIGSSSYAIPSGAVFVSPSGSDSNSGTLVAPVKTMARAVAITPASGTIVMRAGIYHENVTISSRKITIQNYPGEQVWMDGAETVSGWTKSGSTWVHSGWDHVFDHSPTTTAGAADGTAASWSFLNTAYPMAAHPDMMWLNGTQLRQADSAADVTSGTFYYDESGKNLILGSDPSGKTVEAASLQKALSVRVAGTVIRGIGIRRYATSMPQIAAVTLEKPNIILENVVVDQAATAGIALTSTDITLRHVTASNCGNRGITGNYADRADLDAVRVVGNNMEHFNYAPMAGGAKFGKTHGLTVTDSVFANNFGKGLWADMSTSNMTITGDDFIRNDQYGAMLEVSATAVVANNRFLNNTSDGLRVNNTQDVQVYNNTFVGNAMPIYVVQDSRLAADPADSVNLDPRRPVPDSTMTWLIGSMTISNNVFAVPNSSSGCMICVNDSTKSRTAEEIGIHTDHNLYNRISSPSRFAMWSKGSSGYASYSTLAAFQAATGQEAHGLSVDGAGLVNTSTGALNSSMVTQALGASQALSSSVTSLMGVPSGAQMGAYGIS